MADCVEFRSGCPLTSALDLIGDKWSLIIIRGLLAGAARYRDFLAGPEAVATNILADRLKRLERYGLIQRTGEAGKQPVNYRLTRSGADLLPVLQALAQWGHANLPDRWSPPDWFERARSEDFYPARPATSGGAAG